MSFFLVVLIFLVQSDGSPDYEPNFQKFFQTGSSLQNFHKTHRTFVPFQTSSLLGYISEIGVPICVRMMP